MMVTNKELKEQTEHNIQGLAKVDVFNLRVATVGVYIYICGSVAILAQAA